MLSPELQVFGAVLPGERGATRLSLGSVPNPARCGRIATFINLSQLSICYLYPSSDILPYQMLSEIRGSNQVLTLFFWCV